METIRITKNEIQVFLAESGAPDVQPYMDKIRHVSRTEAQPFAAVNFRDGLFVGGQTMTGAMADLLLAKSREAGFAIESAPIPDPDVAWDRRMRLMFGDDIGDYFGWWS